MDKMQHRIGVWGEETFNHTEEHLPALHKHLSEEVAELGEAIDVHLIDTMEAEAVAEECADVFILLCSIAHLCDFSLRENVELKMGRNRARKWGKPDKDGVIRHLSTVEGA